MVKAYSETMGRGDSEHETRFIVRIVSVAELKNRLSKYPAFAKDGEEIVIRDRNLPVAKLVPFSAHDSTEEELLLVAAGRMRLPKHPIDLEKLLRVPVGRVIGREVTQALLDVIQPSC